MKTKFKNLIKYIYTKPLLMCFIIAITLNLILEILNRKSFLNTLSYLIRNPLAFLCSTLIITITLSIGLLVKRKIFAFSVISATWLIVGITNFILLNYRSTPLSNIDFMLVRTAFNMIGTYLSVVQIILIIILLLIILAFIIILWFKVPKQKLSFKNSFTIIISLVLTTALATGFGINAKSIPEDFDDLATAYNDYGFVYCFSLTFIDNGIDTPDNYSEENVNEIISKLNYNTKVPDILPNIITVQLESFFDVNYLTDEIYTNETYPISNFTRLRDESISGFLTVPGVGSGTANTEFEVLTGIDVNYFGAGEFPYYTILKQSSCDSVAYALKKYNYTTHAIHNNTATFYERNEVYPNLGFDTFTSLEYMCDVEYTENGWAKDYALIDSISDCLQSTAGRDFVFAVSVQPHGSYPTETESSAYDYYVEQLKEVDDFIGILTDMLSQLDEPTVFILYGDHLPALDFTNDDVNECSLYQTEYIIWANYELFDETSNLDDDIGAYDLFAKVFDILGINSGTVIEARQENLSDSDVLILAYDMLYGENYSNVSKRKTNMRMGINNIKVTGVYQIKDSILIRGNNFNEYSVAFLNNSEKETVFIDSTTIFIPDRKLNENDIIYVGQVSTNNVTLSKSNHFKYINHNEEE